MKRSSTYEEATRSATPARRLSIARCRALLPKEMRSKTDEEIVALRDNLYLIAEVMRAAHVERPFTRATPRLGEAGNASDGFNEALVSLNDAEREGVAERAAILEFEGGFERDVAVRKAIGGWIKKNG